MQGDGGSLKGVALDTILDIVGQPPFQRLGLDARMTGPATANLGPMEMTGPSLSPPTLNVKPSGQSVAGEVPTNGLIDGNVYPARRGRGSCARLDVPYVLQSVGGAWTPGRYPLTSRTALAVDFHTSNLWEFRQSAPRPWVKPLWEDRNRRPAATLAGQGDFMDLGPARWSLAPCGQREGDATGHRVAAHTACPKGPTLKPQAIHASIVGWDTVEASGSTRPRRIAVEHGLLRRGKAEIALNGALVAVFRKCSAQKRACLRRQLPATSAPCASKVSVGTIYSR